MTERNNWIFQLRGEFSAISPSGNRVEIKSQKAQALVVILCYHHPYGLTRAEAGEILWPHKGERSRLDNLKQGLSLLRKLLGSDFIEANTERFRLSDSFSFETDLEGSAKAQGRPFMPLQDGDWFERVRLELDTDDSPPSESLPNSLFQTVIWLAKSRPRAAYQLMRDGFYIAIGMNSHQLREVARQCGRVEGFEEWHDLWLAFGLKGVAQGPYISALKSALRNGVANREPLATAWSGQALAMLHGLGGAFSEAEKYIQILREIPGLPQHVSLLLDGNIARIAGKPSAASELISRFDDCIESEEYWQVRMASSAFRHAANGDIGIAQDFLKRGGEGLSLTGHRLADQVAQMARATIYVASGQHEQGFKLFERRALDNEQVPDPALNIYAKEAMAIHLRRTGEIERAEEIWMLAQKARQFHQMTYTPWDKRFIANLRQG